MTAPIGLARKTLGAGALFFFSVGASAPLTVVAGGVMATYASTGVVGVAAAFATLTGVLGVASVGYVAMSRQLPHPGPFYAQVARGFGPIRGLATVPVALIAYNCIQISLFGLLGVVVGGLLGGAWWVWALVAWLAVATLGPAHITVNARVLSLLLICEIGVLVLFDIAAFSHPATGSISIAPLLPSSLVTDGVGGVFALSVAAFIGYESAAAYGEEARRPAAIARATFGALVFLGILYAVSSWALVVAVGPDDIRHAATEPGVVAVPIAVLGAHYGSIVALFATLLLVSSIFAAMLSFHNTIARYVFVLSRERVLPAWLGRVGRGSRAGAPWAASCAQSLIALPVVLTCALAGADPMTTLFTRLSTVAAVGVMTLMLVSSLAALRFYRAGGGANEGGWTRVVGPTLGAVAMAAVLATTVANLDSMLGTRDGSPMPWVLLIGAAVATGAGAVWAIVLSRRGPDACRAIGRGEPEPLAELEHHLATVDV